MWARITLEHSSVFCWTSLRSCTVLGAAHGTGSSQADDEGVYEESGERHYDSAVAAVRRNDLQGLKDLLHSNQNAVYDVDSKDYSALHWAARNGNLDLVDTLLASSADVDAVQHSRRTPLMYAAMHGSVEICRALLKHGATVDAIDNSEETALIFAVRGGHTAPVELLLSYGAAANVENLDSESVLDMSLERAQHGGEAAERSEEITALLRQKLKEV